MAVLTNFGVFVLTFGIISFGPILISGSYVYKLPSDTQRKVLASFLSNDTTGMLDWFDLDYYRHPDLSGMDRHWWDNLKGLHNDNSDVRAQRKEVRQMTKREWERYSSAVKKMSETFPDPKRKDMSEFHIFLSYHTFIEAPSAHFGSGFPGWHREYVARFEYVLQQHDLNPDEPPIGIPYVDLTLDGRLPVAHDSILWTERFFGNNDGIVTTGPFAGFKSLDYCEGQQVGEFEFLPLSLARFRNDSRQIGLWKDTDAQEFVKSKSEFWELVCEECGFELVHGGGHWFINGHMNDIPCAPTDPIFYSHHAYVDCLFEEFRMQSQINDSETDYPSGLDGFNLGFPEGAHAAYAPMSPFEPLRNIDGLSNFYRDHLYTYTTRPSSIMCSRHEDCGTCGNADFLWCNRKTSRCVSKIREGGVCGYEGENEENQKYHSRCKCLQPRARNRCRKAGDGLLRCQCETNKQRKYN